MCCVVVFIHLRMETPLRGRSGGHAGTAPTVSFGQITRGRLVSFEQITRGCLMLFGWITHGWLVSFGWITRKWLFGLCGIAWQNMMEISRGGAYVPARVVLQGRIHRSSPRAMRMFLVWKRRCADVRAGTQAPPLRFRLGGLHVGRLVSLGWIVHDVRACCLGA